MFAMPTPKVQTIKGHFTGLPAFQGIFVDKYAKFPKDLPDAVFKGAYESSDPPVPKANIRMEFMAKHVPLRSSSKLLRQQLALKFTPTRAAIQGGSSHPQDLTSIIRKEMQDGMSQIGQAWGAHFHQQGHRDPHITYLGKHAHHNDHRDQQWHGWGSSSSWDPQEQPSQKWWGEKMKPSTRLALEDGKTRAEHAAAGDNDEGKAAVESAPADAEAEGEGGMRKSSEDLEEAAYQALASRKRPAASEGQSFKKRPAAATNEVTKAASGPKSAAKETKAVIATKGASKAAAAKTVGKVINFGYQLKWTPEDKHRDRNTFCSLHYGRAKAAVKRARPSASSDDITATTRYIFQKAGALWGTKQNA